MSERAKMVNVLVKECEFSEEEAGNVYDIRCALLHSGTCDKTLNRLSQLEKCLVIVVLGIQQTVHQQFTNLK